MHSFHMRYYLRSALRSFGFNLAERCLWYNGIWDFVCLSCDMHPGEDKSLPHR